MKTLFLSCLIALAGLTACASNNVHPHLAEKAMLQREIAAQIVCPEFVTRNSTDNTVRAIVSVTEQGQIQLHDISAADNRLVNYVSSELKHLNLKSSAPKGTDKFVLVIKFLAL